jgi:hypothetical protein
MKIIWGEPKLELTKAERKGGLRALQAIRDLFGPKGENWIKGDFRSERENNLGEVFETFCLIGAVQEVDGRYEDVARLAIALVLPKVELRELIEGPNGDGLENADDIEGSIIDFNDSKKVRWADIKGVLNRAKKFLEKGL